MLEDLDVGHIPMISVWNKVDVCADPEMVQKVADKRSNTVCISAQTGQGLPELMRMVERKVQEGMMPVDVLVPYAQVNVLNIVQESVLLFRCGVNSFVKDVGIQPTWQEFTASLSQQAWSTCLCVCYDCVFSGMCWSVGRAFWRDPQDWHCGI